MNLGSHITVQGGGSFRILQKRNRSLAVDRRRFGYIQLKSGLYVPTMDWEQFHNGMTTVGLTAAIAAELGGGTQVSTWYMGLVDNAGWTAFAAGDTMGSHAGWAESVAYSEGVRQTLTFASASGGAIATSAPCSYTMTGTVSLKGVFVVSNSSKGGSTGTLRATAAFGSLQSLSSGQVFQSNYNSAYADS